MPFSQISLTLLNSSSPANEREMPISWKTVDGWKRFAREPVFGLATGSLARLAQSMSRTLTMPVKQKIYKITVNLKNKYVRHNYSQQGTSIMSNNKKPMTHKYITNFSLKNISEMLSVYLVQFSYSSLNGYTYADISKTHTHMHTYNSSIHVYMFTQPQAFAMDYSQKLTVLILLFSIFISKVIFIWGDFFISFIWSWMESKKLKKLLNTQKKV